MPPRALRGAAFRATLAVPRTGENGMAAKTEHALERLVFFSDAVFAIAITLLVIEIHAPDLPRDSSDEAYLIALAHLVPSFVGYLVSFWVIGMFWMGHHRIFAFAARQSPSIVGWNLFLLGSIAFMPFSTAFLSANGGDRVPTVFYCVSLLLCAVLNVRVGRIATSPPMVDPSASAGDIAYIRRRGMSVVLGAAVALIVGFFVPAAAQAALISIPLWRYLLTRWAARDAPRPAPAPRRKTR
jgi:uncharacterized membrane protein